MIDRWTGSQLARITSGTWNKTPPALPLDQIEIDHRNLDSKGLFVALAGAHHDGHDFVNALQDQQCALVNTITDKSAAAQLQVADPLTALGALAKAAMAETKAQKIAITGSVGKTGTKAALATILSVYGTCHASKGNLNNHIGAPLSMARASAEAAYIIIEMGMNHAQEIAPLSALFDGDIAIITKIAESHIGHFETVAQIAEAKSEIFEGMSQGIAILPSDDAHFDILAQKARQKGLQLICFGRTQSADIQLIAHSFTETGQQITIANHLDGETLHVSFGLKAAHHATTALILIATLHALGLDWQQAKSQLAELREVAGRGDANKLQIKGHNVLLINDSYNAGPASMTAALADMARRPEAHKTVILTDMLELGDKTHLSHEALIPYIEAAKPALVLCAGSAMAQLCAALPDEITAHHYEDATSLINALDTHLPSTDVILVKGSNGSGAPAIARHLLEAYQTAHQTPTPVKGAMHVS